MPAGEIAAVSTTMPLPPTQVEPAGNQLTTAATPPAPPPSEAVPADADLSYLGIGANADYLA
ncbi:MAG: hypothetical protein QGH40_00950 [bacterium]|nr:hypothetical protein [bacterium]